MLERIGRQRIENQLFILYIMKCDICANIKGYTSNQWADEDWFICPDCLSIETKD